MGKQKASEGKLSRVANEAMLMGPSAVKGFCCILPVASTESSGSDAHFIQLQESFAAARSSQEGNLEIALCMADARERMLELFPDRIVDEALEVADRTPDGLFTARAVWSALVLNGKAVKLVAHRGQAEGNSITRSELLSYLRLQRERTSSCLSLPMTVLSFGIVAAGIVLHFKLSSVHSVSYGVESNMKAYNLSRVHPDNSWNWLANIAGNTFAVGSEVVGGARFAPLPAGSSHEAAFGTTCEYTAWNFVADALKSGELPPRQAISPVGCMNATASGQWFLPWALKGTPDARSLLARARNSSWREGLDEFDGFGVQMLLRNKANSFYALVTVFVEFDLIGLPFERAIIKAFDGRPAWLDVSEDWTGGRAHLLVLDLLFIGGWGAFAFGKIWSFLLHCCRKGCRQACRRQATIWKVLDALNLVMGIPCIMLYTWSVYVVGGLNTIVDEMPELSPGSLSQGDLASGLQAIGLTEEGFAHRVDLILEQSSRMVNAQSELVWYTSVLAICTSLRFFESFRANPRLHVVTRTLHRVWLDLAHLLIVSITVLMVFAVTGYMIFGSNIQEFSTFGDAFGSVLLIVMGYLYDEVATDMKLYGGHIGMVWIWLLIIVFALILLNMLLAMVVDEYIGVRAAAGRAPSLVTQVKDIALSRRRRAVELEWRANESSHSWPGPAPVVSNEEKKTSIWDALSAFSDSSVWRRLEDPQIHPAEQMTAASLSQALGAEKWADKTIIDMLIGRASEEAAEQAQKDEVTSLADALRFCTRLDSNMRDVSNHLRDASEAMCAGQQGLQDYRALVDSIGDGAWLKEALDSLPALHPAASAESIWADEIELWDLSPPPSPPVEEEGELDLPHAMDMSYGSDFPSRLASQSPSRLGTPQVGTESYGLMQTTPPAPADFGSLAGSNIDYLRLPDEPPLNARGRAEQSAAGQFRAQAEGTFEKLADFCTNLERQAGGGASLDAKADTAGNRLENLEALVDRLNGSLQRMLDGGGAILANGGTCIA